MDAEMINTTLRQILFMTFIEYLDICRRHGILETVEKEKMAREIENGPEKVRQYQITDAAVFLKFSEEVFDCVAWDISPDTEGFTAVTKKCVFCGMAKKTNSPRPCMMTCIAPFAGVLQGINSKHSLEVKETLWEGDRCVFRVNRPQ